MRIGLIARADNTGLGIQTKEFFDHIPSKALVIDMTEQSSIDLIKPRLERYPNQMVYKIPKGFGLMGGIPENVINDFIKDVDVVFSMETFYDYNIINLCRKRGIKTILQLNYEFLDYPSNRIPAPDLFAAPSMWFYDEIPSPKKFLPVPVDLTKFVKTKRVNTFVHIAGRQAIHDRNGTQLLMDALNYVTRPMHLIVRSQQPINFRSRNPLVHVTLDCNNKENYWENYSGGVMVLPRKYGGLCLPINEALASGMPVIVPDISPNNTWLPQDWLIPSRLGLTLKSKKTVPVYEVNIRRLAMKMDQFTHEQTYDRACETASELANSISWETLLPVYQQTFRELYESK